MQVQVTSAAATRGHESPLDALPGIFPDVFHSLDAAIADEHEVSTQRYATALHNQFAATCSTAII
jgi:hypothetical protein